MRALSSTIFEWDEQKAINNRKKHHVDFELATYVFYDPFVLIEQDRFENGEYRWQAIGKAKGESILLVAHTSRFDNDVEVIRIISARKTTKKERLKYDNCQI